MKKKIRLAAIVALALLFLVGWGKQSVKLLNDSKLIDLEAALQVCLHGSGMSEGEENTDNPDAPVSTQTPADQTDEERIIVISVKDRVITYDAGEEIPMNKLEARIRQDYGKKVTFQLVDDYAEAHVYRRIRSILSKLADEMGLEYTERRGE